MQSGYFTGVRVKLSAYRNSDEKPYAGAEHREEYVCAGHRRCALEPSPPPRGRRRLVEPTPLLLALCLCKIRTNHAAPPIRRALATPVRTAEGEGRRALPFSFSVSLPLWTPFSDVLVSRPGRETYGGNSLGAEKTCMKR